jgi:iron complex outermembrane receptor protein
MSRSPQPRVPTRRLALAIALTLPGATALAQDSSTSQPTASTLDTVQVTAQRRVENIQDVPVSISAVNAEQLQVLASGGQDVRYLSGRVPSLNIESSFGRAFPRFYIRGYGNTDFRLNTSQPVSLVYDDVVQENPILKGFPLFDLAGVEVLRGPQGSLFGRNSPAGVVKFDSVRPSQETEGYAKVGYGRYNQWNLEGAVGGALSERWSARASMLYQRRDDWVDNAYPGPNDGFEGYDETAARVQFLYEGDGFEALLGAHARHLNGTARLFRANIIEPGTNNLVPGFDRTKVTQDGLNYSELDSQGANARLSWDLGDYKLYSITGYESVETINRGDIDGGYGAVYAPPSGPGLIPFASETADGIPEHKQYTQEFRIESAFEGPWNWQAGLFYFDEDYQVESFSYDTLFAAGAQSGYERIRQTNKSWAAFGAATWQATDALELRAGLRYTVDEKDLTVQAYQGVKGGLPELAAGEPDGNLSASPEDKKLSWDLSGVYKLSDATNLFARVATGYRGSSIQAAGDFNNQSVASPETSTSYEFGIKSDFWDKRARLSANVFYYEVKDQQLTAVGGAANANILLNADKSVGQGFELDMQAYLADNLLVTLGSSYNDTEIKDPGLAVAVCAQCTVTDPRDAQGRALIDGNALPQAPKWTHNMTARWGIPMADGSEFYIYTDWAYRSEVNFFLYESAEFTGKPTLEGGLRLGYAWHYGDYEVAAYGRNITDQERVVGAIDFNNLTGFLNEPRTYGVEFTAKF